MVAVGVPIDENGCLDTCTFAVGVSVDENGSLDPRLSSVWICEGITLRKASDLACSMTGELYALDVSDIRDESSFVKSMMVRFGKTIVRRSEDAVLRVEGGPKRASALSCGL